jgi:hypothetical protein
MRSTRHTHSYGGHHTHVPMRVEESTGGNRTPGKDAVSTRSVPSPAMRIAGPWALRAISSGVSAEDTDATASVRAPWGRNGSFRISCHSNLLSSESTWREQGHSEGSPVPSVPKREERGVGDRHTTLSSETEKGGSDGSAGKRRHRRATFREGASTMAPMSEDYSPQHLRTQGSTAPGRLALRCRWRAG